MTNKTLVPAGLLAATAAAVAVLFTAGGHHATTGDRDHARDCWAHQFDGRRHCAN